MTDMSSVLDRMVHIRDVAWGRNPHGGFWVQWLEDGERKTSHFRTAHSAENLARWLDVTGPQPTARDVRNAEKALRELEKVVRKEEESAVKESLEELERFMTGLEPRLPKTVRIGRYIRRPRRK